MSVGGGGVAKHAILSERSTQLLGYLGRGKGAKVLHGFVRHYDGDCHDCVTRNRRFSPLRVYVSRTS